MKVNEILTQDPQYIGPDASLESAAMRMKTFDVGILPVCEGDSLIGTVTDRDITVRGIAEGRDPKNTPIREVMTVEPAFCFEDQEVEEAALMMERRQIRRLPVLSRGHRLVGIMSIGDLAVRTGQEQLAGEVLERVSEPAHLEGK